MPRDRTLISLADLVKEAAAIVDPNGADPAVSELVERYEDADDPARGILEGLPERLRWGADEHPPVVVAQAIVLYLAHRLDDTVEDPGTLLQLVARAEFDSSAAPGVAQWFAEHDVELGVPTPPRR